MRLTVTTLADEIFTFEVADDMELDSFRALCEIETGITAREIVVFWNGRPLHDDRLPLKDYGIRDGDVLLLQRVQGERGQPTAGRHMSPAVQQPGPQPTLAGPPPMIDFSQIQIPGGASAATPASSSATPAGSGPEDPAVLREILLASPHDLAVLKERNAPLADALLSGSLEKFSEVLNKQREERAERERDRIRLLTADPFDPDSQKLIAEEIRLKNVEHNMETAIEHSPESFGQVTMLYINCNVNGHPVKAFVDSGAQMTIMSQACAERCNIMRLVDTRWAGIAKGVGIQKIIGRVHLCQIQIGPTFLQTSFSILEDQPMDMLLGLDMLKRHQSIIDLESNDLVIGAATTPFLSESELPEYARLNVESLGAVAMDEDQQLAEALAQSAQDTATAAGPSTSRGASSSSQVSSGTRPATQNSGTRPAAYSEADVRRLVEMGFSRSQVIDELTRSNGNVDLAIGALFAKSFQMP